MPAFPDPLALARAGNGQAIVRVVRLELLRRGWPAQVHFADNTLHIHLLGSLPQGLSPPGVAAQLFLMVKQLRIPRLEQLEIRAFRGSQLLWQHSLRLGSQPRWDRFSFDSWTVNLWTYPAAVVVALLVNNIALLQVLHLPWHIWIHELGHATIAWWSGHRALPLPFGWTSISSQRDPFVYFGILFLLALLFKSAREERIRWLQPLAIVLALLQFYMTWLMPNRTKEMLITFGGVGGEFYISTFLIACFYLRLPDRWRWDFWRFVVLGVAASSLWRSFWQWHRIQKGLASIPWGTLLGGQGDAGGDMNRLVDDFGWSADQIIQTYKWLGNLCVLLILCLYVIFLLQMNDEIWLNLQARLILWADALFRRSKRH
ncbi:hypothetical protein NW841_03305 [Synechococcus sp. H60.3]|uniref:hypothetical protein n=1 Tax=Synechococcus sp. H60.3 TaxID=2967124 RepID=UPI0039C0219B